MIGRDLIPVGVAIPGYGSRTVYFLRVPIKVQRIEPGCFAEGTFQYFHPVDPCALGFYMVPAYRCQECNTMFVSQSVEDLRAHASERHNEPKNR